MALVVGRLMAELGINDSGFTAGMSRARSEMQRTDQASNRLAAAGAKAKTSLAGVGGNTAGLTRTRGEMQQAVVSGNNLAASAGRARSALASIGIGLSLTAVVAGMTQAVGAARALGAQTNQMNVVFGESKARIVEWGQSAVDSMRMSQREAQGAAVQFATFGKAAGLSGDQLANFSMKTTKLAADLASFQGIPVAEAIQAMGSALAGQSEPMRQYGVLLDENTLKEAAYANGIAAKGQQLTQQQKVAATYYAMLGQLDHVQGDVERSAGKFGASLKTLTSRLEETQASVGQKLIPVIQPFVDLLAGPGLSAVEGFATVIGKAGSAFASLPGPVQAALAAVVAFRLAQRYLGDQMTAMGTRISGVVGSFRTLGQAVQVQTTMGAVSMGRFGSSIARLGSHVPIVARMQTAFVNAAIGAERFPRAAGAASAAMVGMKGAASGLIGALGGPWGVAVMGATALLGLWISQKQKDQQASQEAAARTDQYADAISQAGGVIDSQVRKMVSKRLADKDAFEQAKELGIGEKELTDIIVERGSAYDDLIARLGSLGTTSGDTFGSMEQLKGTIKETAGELEAAESKAMEMARANGDVTVSFDGSQQAAGAMSEAMTDFAESTDGAAGKVDKLSKTLKGLYDDEFTLEDALIEWEDSLQDFAKTLGETGTAAVDASGKIDLTSESGRKLYQSVRDLGGEMRDSAAATLQNAQANGATMAEALDQTRTKLESQRKAFIDLATAKGMDAAMARKLADELGLVPDKIVANLNVEGVENALKDLARLKIESSRIEGTFTMVDNTPEVRKKLDEMKVKYSIIDGKVVIEDNTPEVMSALNELGVKTTSLPEGYIQIDDTTPENMARLEALGIKTQTLPDGTIVVNVDDSDFNAKLPKWTEPVYKQIIAQGVGFGDAAPGGGVFRGPGIAANAYGSIRQRAEGALDTPQIQSGSGMGRYAVTPFGPVQWAEGETDWEAFIPGALSKRGRATAILKETARRFGYGLAPLVDLARGDYTPAMREIWGLEEDSPIVDAILSARHRVMAEGGITAGGLKNYMRGIDGASYVWGGWGQGFNTDCSGGQSIAVNATNGNTAAGTGQRSATGGYSSWLPAQGYQIGRAPAGIPAHEVGWSAEHTSGTIFDPQGGDVNIEMGGGNGGGAYGRGAVSSRDGQFPNQAWKALEGDNGLGVTGVAPAATERERNIDAVVAEGKRRGKSDKEIKSAVMTVLAETNGENLGHGMDGDNAGLFQQRDSWGTREERMNPTTAAGKYFDAMDGVAGRDTMSEAELAQAIQRSSDSSGGIYAAKSAEADQMMAASMARLSGGDTTNNITMGGTGGVGGGNVFVTGGHLDYIGNGGPTSSATTPTSPSTPDAGESAGTDGSLRITSPFMRGQQPLRFQEGGTIPGTGRGDKVPLLGEPGEEIIRRDVASKPGMRKFLKKLNEGFYGEVPRYQDGGTVGFGGYADDTRDHMKPKNWRDYAHLAVGAGFTGASLVAPYVAMAQSGQIDLGNLAPTIDTGSNSVDGLPQFVGDYASQITDQLGAILVAIQKGERITVVVESDKSPSAAAMGATAAGL